jgi:multidrug efflux pump subunit AcrA (membrane-fusion protein)
VTDDDRLSLTRSLEAEVRAAYAVESREGLNRSALLAALENLRPERQTIEAALKSAGFMPPDAEDAPILHWVDSVFEHWHAHYPLAGDLHAILDNARPLAAAFALKDSRFFTPGAHALHRLLDVMHEGFAGWYDGLGGNSRNALEGAREAIERARRNFPSEPEVDSTLELLSQKISGHAAQLARLDPILLERETATMGEDIARIESAIVINELLEAHQVPGSVARFMKSDWFESGIIIAEREGVQSDAWRSFQATTQLLVDAVQPVTSGDPEGQNRLQQTMQHLPGTLSRQLHSLQPDSDAVAGAVGLIEYALLRNMRGEDLGLLSAEPIQVHGLPEDGLPSDAELAQEGIVQGRWYVLQTSDGDMRVRLAGMLAANAYLLFMDFLGARATRKTYAEFSQLLKSGEAKPIVEGNSFCRAMVEATEARQAVRAEQEAEQAKIDAEAAEQRAREEEAQAAAAAVAAKAQAEAEERARAAREEAARAAQSPQQAQQKAQQPPPSQQSAPQNREAPSDHHSHTELSAPHNDPNAMPATEAPYESNTVVKLQLPMGTWMGFHDREPPMMARVAVRDLEKDSYIFTNRDGIKLRELTVAQLIGLIERDMVDILERKTNFRETIQGMQGQQSVRYEDQGRLA